MTIDVFLGFCFTFCFDPFQCIKKIPKDVVLADCQRVASEVKRSCVRCARVLPGDRPKGALGISKQQALLKALASSEADLDKQREENEELKRKLEAVVKNPSVSLTKMKVSYFE